MLERFDRDLFLLLNRWGTPDWDPIWLAISDKEHWIPLYLILVYHCFVVLGWRKTLLVLGGSALLILLTDQTANLFKSGVARLRPCHLPELDSLVRQVKSSCGGKFGFFSAHAANSMAIAMYLGLIFRRHVTSYIWVLLFWSIMVGYSRIYLGVHYPGDVLTGFAVGALWGWLLYQLLEILSSRWKLS